MPLEEYIPSAGSRAYVLEDGTPIRGAGGLQQAPSPGLGAEAGDTFAKRVTDALASVVGYQKASEVVVGLEDFIKSRAEEGAKRAVIKYGLIVVVLAVIVPILINKTAHLYPGARRTLTE